MKFSIIIPVYNVEKYLSDCLESVLNQTYDNYEVIVVDDGSTDNSYKIMQDFQKKYAKISIYSKENSGVSDTRNYGIEKATGDYMMFIDSDDAIDSHLLEKINEVINGNKDIDIVKYKIKLTDNDKVINEETFVFDSLTGEEAFLKLYNSSLFVCPVAYAYRREFWLNNNFEFATGRLHEDFGLIPYVILKADKVTSIDFEGYCYYVRENSIMTSNSEDKVSKKNVDCLYHYDFLVEKAKEIKDNYTKKIFLSYVSYALINRSNKIKNKDMLREYVSELKKRKIGNNLIDDSIPRRIKKVMFNISPMMFIKLFVK